MRTIVRRRAAERVSTGGLVDAREEAAGAAGVGSTVGAEKLAHVGFFEAHAAEDKDQPDHQKRPGQYACKCEGKGDAGDDEREVARVAHEAVGAIFEQSTMRHVAGEVGGEITVGPVKPERTGGRQDEAESL